MQLLPISQHWGLPGNWWQRGWWRDHQSRGGAGDDNDVAGVAIARVAVDDATCAASVVVTVGASVDAAIAAAAGAPGRDPIRHPHLVTEALGKGILVYLELGDGHVLVS